MSKSTGQDRPRRDDGAAGVIEPAPLPDVGRRRRRRRRTAATPTQPARAADAITWDREADVVVIGAGAGGLPAAIAAREKGASVIIVEMNFDIGGRCMMSFGGLYIGGGNRHAEGDRHERHARPRVRRLGAHRDADGPVQRPRAGAHLCRRQSRPVRLAREARREMGGLPAEAGPARSLAHAAQLLCLAERGDQSACAARASCGRWRRPRARWASRSCSSSG